LCGWLHDHIGMQYLRPRLGLDVLRPRILLRLLLLLDLCVIQGTHVSASFDLLQKAGLRCYR